MNDEVKSRLIRYADQLEAAAGKGADFLAEQAPETVRQFLAWHFWSAVGLAVLLAVMSCFMLWASRNAWRQSITSESCAGAELEVAGSAFFAATAGASLFFAIINAFTAAKIAIAPNVFIIEKLAEMAK